MIELPPSITDEMWWAMCNHHMGVPVALSQADLTQPFVYERRFGVFSVPFGHHSGAMALLLALQYDKTSYLDVTQRLDLKPYDVHAAADYWLMHTPGAAFRSSQGKSLLIGTRKGLTVQERRAFAHAKALDED